MYYDIYENNVDHIEGDDNNDDDNDDDEHNDEDQNFYWLDGKMMPMEL